MIKEVYDEDRMMKITVDPIKRQKDQTRLPENLGWKWRMSDPMAA